MRFLGALFCALTIFGSVHPAVAAQRTNLENDVTTAALSDGNFSSWLSHPVTVTLKAPTWADATKYHFGEGDFTQYFQPLAINKEGKTTLFFQSSSADSIEPLQTAEIWLDFKAPSIPGDVVYSRPQNDGFSYNFGPSKDFLSGVGSYEITVISVATSSTVTTETVTGTSGSVSKLSAGTYDFSYAARDLAGNLSQSHQSQVMVGLDKPVITYVFDDPQVAQKAAQGDWITQGVDVRLTASIASEAPTSTLKLQTISGSLTTTDVAQVNYSSIPLIISEEGEGRVAIGVTDLYGNESTESSCTLKVDRTAPSTPTFLSVNTATAVSDSTKRNLSVAWTPSYDAASGLNCYRITLARHGDGFSGITQKDATIPYDVFTDVEPGIYDITIQAFDKAGLASSASTITKVVSVPAASTSSQSSGSGSAASAGSSSASSDDASVADDADAQNDTLVADNTGVETTDAAIDEDASGADLLGSLGASKHGGSEVSARTPWEKFLDYLKNEWMIWVPSLLGLIILVIALVYLVRNRKKEIPPLDPSGRDDESFSDTLGVSEFEELHEPTQKLTAQPETDQTVNYFKINENN